jgi:dTDP-4-amino-4,6-dideoxygalactose transaminase
MVLIESGRREYRALKDELDVAIYRVLDSGVYVLGEDVAALEREFAAFCGARHAVSTASGTMALIVGLKALGIGSGTGSGVRFDIGSGGRDGDEVIAPAYTSICTTAAITHAGGTVRLADVEEETLTLDPADVERRITPRTRAIIPVHLHGQMAHMDALLELSIRRSLRVLEDAALAVGAMWAGRQAGTIGEAGAVSFAPTKVLGGLGWGGMLLTNHDDVAYRARQLAGFGLPGGAGETELNLEGYNAQMSSVLAAMLRVKLRHLPAGLARRRAIAARYDEACDRLGIRRLHAHDAADPSPRVYVIRLPNRDALARHLREAGLDASPHFVPPLHLRPVYAHLGYRRGDFPVAERVTEELLCLPVHPYLTDDEVTRVIDVMSMAKEVP